MIYELIDSEFSIFKVFKISGNLVLMVIKKFKDLVISVVLSFQK